MPVDLPPGSHRLDPAHHPTPFSADQIREACGPGRRNVYRVDEAGEAPYLNIWWFEEGDDGGAIIARHHAALDGTPSTPVTRGRSAWIDLQRHASYPSTTTRIEIGEVTTPAGRFACWGYVTDEDGAVTRAWFARRLPGPPVLISTVRDGHEVFRSELVDVVDPREA